jgi:predicted RNA polymerase sigma factor
MCCHPALTPASAIALTLRAGRRPHHRGDRQGLYGLFRRMSDNPVVALNHAVAVAMVHGPSAALELVRALDGDARISGHYRLDAVRGHLFEMAGDHERAAAHYRAAAERTTSIPERDYLVVKAARAGARG